MTELGCGFWEQSRVLGVLGLKMGLGIWAKAHILLGKNMESLGLESGQWNRSFLVKPRFNK